MNIRGSCRQLVNKAQKMKSLFNIIFTVCAVPFPQNLTARNTNRFVIYPVLLLIYQKLFPFLLYLNVQDIWDDLFCVMNFRADFGRKF